MPGLAFLCRRAYERLLRKLLLYRQRPAVALMQAFTWDHMHGYQWSNDPYRVRDGSGIGVLG